MSIPIGEGVNPLNQISSPIHQETNLQSLKSEVNKVPEKAGGVGEGKIGDLGLEGNSMTSPEVKTQLFTRCSPGLSAGVTYLAVTEGKELSLADQLTVQKANLKEVKMEGGEETSTSKTRAEELKKEAGFQKQFGEKGESATQFIERTAVEGTSSNDEAKSDATKPLSFAEQLMAQKTKLKEVVINLGKDAEGNDILKAQKDLTADDIKNLVADGKASMARAAEFKQEAEFQKQFGDEGESAAHFVARTAPSNSSNVEERREDPTVESKVGGIFQNEPEALSLKKNEKNDLEEEKVNAEGINFKDPKTQQEETGALNKKREDNIKEKDDKAAQLKSDNLLNDQRKEDIKKSS